MNTDKPAENTSTEKDEERDCSKLPEDGQSARDIALARCECLMDRYLRWKRDNLKKSDRAQSTALAFTAITPVSLLLPWNRVNILGAAASAVAAIASGLLAIFGWRENHIRYGYVWHALQTEKYRYLTRATKEYADDDREKAARNFAGRVEQLVMTEVTDWRSEMQRVEQNRRNDAPPDSAARATR